MGEFSLNVARMLLVLDTFEHPPVWLPNGEDGFDAVIVTASGGAAAGAVAEAAAGGRRDRRAGAVVDRSGGQGCSGPGSRLGLGRCPTQISSASCWVLKSPKQRLALLDPLADTVGAFSRLRRLSCSGDHSETLCRIGDFAHGLVGRYVALRS